MTVSQNYFQLFGFEPKFDIDLNHLASAYRKIQRTTHPDRHAHASKRDQLLSMQYAANINDAYDTLKCPLKRATYLLKLNGLDLTDDNSTDMDPEFLMHQIELREKLEAVQHAADPEIELDKVSVHLDQQMNGFQEMFREAIGGNAKNSLDKAAEMVKKMQFIVKMQHEVERLEEQLLDY